MSKRIQKILKRSPSGTQDQRGLILITIVIAVSALMIVGFALIGSTTSNYILTKNNSFNANALLTAEAGIEQSLQGLNSNDNFSGYPSAQQFFNNAAQGRGEYTTTITSNPNDANGKIITSTGKVYRYNSSKLIGTRVVRVTAVGTQSQGYSLYAGPGGLTVSGNGAITNSDIYVNGTISLSGNSKIGTVSQPVNVNVANYACPAGSNPGPSYPALCTSSQPISLSSNTSIYGTVCATGQTSTGPSNNIQGGSTGQGLQLGCVAPAVSMPTYDRAAHKSNVAIISAGNDNTYVCGSGSPNRTWPANLKLTGNVSISGNCRITVKGNVYITGDLSISGSGQLRVDNSVGSVRPVVMTDGKITISGSGQLITNSAGTSMEFISFKSSAACSPECTSLSGTELKTSAGTETISISGSTSLPGMIFNAYWGKIRISGSGTFGAAVGQTIDMSGSGTITFGTTLSSGSRTWTITSYQQRYPGQP